MILDILVRFKDGGYCNVEIQKRSYAFPGQRSACYSAELRILDRNTVQYMIDDMQATIDTQTQQLNAKDKQLSVKDRQLDAKDKEIAELKRQLAKTMKE